MIEMKPTLNINRLVAFKNAKIVLDKKFHNGLNVIYGSNGSGKTSIIQLLVFALGYTVEKWKDEAGSCDYVIAEIIANGSIITIGRAVNEHLSSMDIYYGDYETSQKNLKEGWFNHPYIITPSKESFSQKIFSILDMPEAKSDGVNNLTLHQILRIIYNNQSCPATSIFNDEPFDSAIKREFVSNYLLGLFDNNLYNNKLELIQKDKELTKATAELKGLFSLIQDPKSEINFEDIEKSISELQVKIENLITEIEFQKEQDVALTFKDEVNSTSPANMIKNKKSLVMLEIDLKALDYDINDSKLFIEELESKLESINDAIRFGRIYKKKEFDVCPSCFSKLPHIENENACSLCGSDDAEKNTEDNYARMKNELEIQIRESNIILKRNIKKQEDICQEIRENKSLLRKNINKISVISNSINSSLDSNLYEKYRKIGELEEKIDNLIKLSNVYNKIGELKKNRDNLQARVTELKELINLKELSLSKEIPIIKSKIESNMKAILEKDVENITDVEDKAEFSNIKSIDVDLASNRIIVNNKVSFSESSMFYLNNALHLSLLQLSLDDPKVRFPRLLILDGIENGGMEDVRSKGMQKTIKELSDKYNTIRHQIILTTKSIYPPLDNENYRVGDKLTKQNRSLLL